MKRTSALLRGTKGQSWYLDYMQKGKEGFKKTVPPTPFDWTLPSNAGDTAIKRTKAFFDVSIGQALVGRLTFELADDIVPTTVKNFSLLCTGSNIHERSFKGTKFFNILKGSFIMGGDVELNDGTGSYSAYKERYIEDENFIIPHTHRGLLRYAFPLFGQCMYLCFSIAFFIVVYRTAWLLWA